MTNGARRKSDMATMERREEADKILINNRDRNDALTQERRFEADKTMVENRARNDEITANRREMKDGNQNETILAVSFALIILAITVLFIFLLR